MCVARPVRRAVRYFYLDSTCTFIDHGTKRIFNDLDAHGALGIRIGIPLLHLDDDAYANGNACYYFVMAKLGKLFKTEDIMKALVVLFITLQFLPLVIFASRV